MEPGKSPELPKKNLNPLKRALLVLGGAVLLLASCSTPGNTLQSQPLEVQELVPKSLGTAVPYDVQTRTFNDDYLPPYNPGYEMTDYCKAHSDIYYNSQSTGNLLPLGGVGAFITTELDERLGQSTPRLTNLVKEFNSIAPSSCRIDADNPVVFMFEELPDSIITAYVPNAPRACDNGPTLVIFHLNDGNLEDGSIDEKAFAKTTIHELSHTCASNDLYLYQSEVELVKAPIFNEDNMLVNEKPANNNKLQFTFGYTFGVERDGEILAVPVLDEVKAQAFILKHYITSHNIDYSQIEGENLPDEFVDQYQVLLEMLRISLVANGYNIPMQDLIEALINNADESYSIKALAEDILTYKQSEDNSDWTQVVNVIFSFVLNGMELLDETVEGQNNNYQPATELEKEFFRDVIYQNVQR